MPMFSPGQLSQILHQAPLQKPSEDDTTVNINETTKKKTTTRRDNEMKFGVLKEKYLSQTFFHFCCDGSQ